MIQRSIKKVVWGGDEQDGGHPQSTCLNEPLSQQVDGLGHGSVVLRQQLDDILRRSSCLKIPRKGHKKARALI